MIDDAPIDEVEYDSPMYSASGDYRCHVRHRGYQVGRLAVRRSAPNEGFRDERSGAISRGDWYAIDHVPTGISVTNALSFASAMVIADDISRFAAVEDLSATTRDELVAQIGPQLIEWITAMCDRAEPIGYRQWLVERDRGAAAWECEL